MTAYDTDVHLKRKQRFHNTDTSTLFNSGEAPLPSRTQRLDAWLVLRATEYYTIAACMFTGLESDAKQG